MKSSSVVRNPLALAAIVAATMPGLSAEVMPREIPPRPEGLGTWLRRNNRHRRSKVSRKVKSQLNQRLAPATGFGSYDEWKKQLAAQRAAKRLGLPYRDR